MRKELKETWKVKTKVVPVIVAAFATVTAKLEKWLQQIKGKTKISIQESALLRTKSKSPRRLAEDQKLRTIMTTYREKFFFNHKNFLIIFFFS